MPSYTQSTISIWILYEMFVHKLLYTCVASYTCQMVWENFMPHFAQSDVRIARVFVVFFHRHQHAAYLALNGQCGALIILHTSASRAPYESIARVHECVRSLIISIRVPTVTITPGLCACICVCVCAHVVWIQDQVQPAPTYICGGVLVCTCTIIERHFFVVYTYTKLDNIHYAWLCCKKCEPGNRFVIHVKGH